MSNQEQNNDPQYGADYHGNIKISGNEEMPSGSEEPNSKRDQQFVSSAQAIKNSSGTTGGGGDEQRQPDIEPSEVGSGESGTGNQSGDPGRTPGKAEGEDDGSATQSQTSENASDVENYEQTKEKKIAESVSISS
ncbi:MAG TPA: hypothetical protein VK400_00130 [Pyrinomonadaceae bacterium]|nr:hypothetical protein [Pyrinomonadaceae bacterium]